MIGAWIVININVSLLGTLILYDDFRNKKLPTYNGVIAYLMSDTPVMARYPYCVIIIAILPINISVFTHFTAEPV